MPHDHQPPQGGESSRSSVGEATPGPRLTWHHIQEIGSRSLKGLTPSQARRVVSRLGEVGRWLLKPEVIRCARNDAEGSGPAAIPPADWADPRPGQAVGHCRVLVVNRDQERAPLLRPCFVLPLRWREDSAHSPHLPRGLTDLADQVIAALSGEARVKERCWGLQLGPRTGFDRCDLSTLGMDGRSACAPWPRA